VGNVEKSLRHAAHAWTIKINISRVFTDKNTQYQSRCLCFNVIKYTININV